VEEVKRQGISFSTETSFGARKKVLKWTVLPSDSDSATTDQDEREWKVKSNGRGGSAGGH